MAQEEKKTPQTPEEMVLAANQEAMRLAMEQVQAMYGQIPGFQMPDLAAAQNQLMDDVSNIPGVAQAQAYQKQIMEEAAKDPDAVRRAYEDQLQLARNMMQQASDAGFGIAPEVGDFFGFGDDEDYEILHKEESPLTDEQKYQLAFGAPLFVFNQDYVDSLESVTDTDTLKEMLEEWWDVKDHDTAMETIVWLLNEGHHADADPALAEVKTRGLDNITDEEKADEENKISAVFAIGEFYVEMNETTVDQLPDTVLAWDLVRAVNVARWAFICGYISENEMWEAIRVTVEIAKNTFNSWEEYGTSFAVGRGIWRGDTTDYELAAEVIEPLLEKEESPWNQMAW